MMAMAGLAMAIGMSSCGEKSNADLLDKFDKLTSEYVEAVNSNDEKKADKLSVEGKELLKELSERDLSPEEKEHLQQKVAEIAGAAIGAAFRNGQLPADQQEALEGINKAIEELEQ